MDSPNVLSGAEVDALRQPFDGRCWWCGSTDLSAEHKFKRSDLAKLDASAEGLYWSDGGPVLQRIRSPKDKRVKFTPNLCKECNNARSQPSDRAWDLMFDYIDANWYRGLRRKKSIDLRAALGDDDAPRRIAEYLVKNMGCTISSSGFAVPQGIRDFLDGTEATREIQGVMFRCRDCWNDERADSNTKVGSLIKSQLYAALDPETMVPRSFMTEMAVGPIGFIIGWSGFDEAPPAFFEVERATIHDRRSLPETLIHSCVRERFQRIDEVRVLTRRWLLQLGSATMPEGRDWSRAIPSHLVRGRW